MLDDEDEFQRTNRLVDSIRSIVDSMVDGNEYLKRNNIDLKWVHSWLMKNHNTVDLDLYYANLIPLEACELLRFKL